MSKHLNQKAKGKFWPQVRAQIWEKAQQFYQQEQARTMGTDYKGITATHKELREAGYFHTHQNKRQKEVKTCPNRE